ncbi:MAG: asparagine synthase [Proteobacteria bacterium]|nr:asparagine synthase [Pseudomonadota bacterium]
MSSLACFYANQRGVRVVFSCIDDCVALNLISFSINWDSIRAQTTGGDYCNSETGLNEITILQCGECLEIADGQSFVKPLWSPAEVARSHLHHRVEFEDAAIALRDVTSACVTSWASLYDSVVLQFSGGFDSSVVLSVLAAMHDRPRITCVNFFSRASGDERRFARSMATPGVELVEVERDPFVDLRMFLRSTRTVRPVLNFSACTADPVNMRIAQERNAKVVFTGELGDNIFGHALGHEVITDYVQRFGIRPSLWGIAMDAAQLGRLSVWTALRRGLLGDLEWLSGRNWSLHRYLVRKKCGRLASDESLSSYEQELGRFIHPWMRDTADLPSGFFNLFSGLISITAASYDSPFASREACLLSAPLASQPLVELALTIPVHLHTYRGISRSLARRAFAHSLSDAVLNRGVGKGTPELWIRDTVERNRPFLKEALMDGVLVSKGFLDRKKVESLLSQEVNRANSYINEIFVQFYIEAWVRQWHQDCLEVAA